MSAAGIRIDSLLHGLKELQNEKQCLEQKLNDRRSQAQTLERRVDHYNTKLTQMKEMSQKLTEMQKVALQKVQQTQEQINSLHDVNQSQSGKIKDLNDSIQQEKDRKLETIGAFQENMSDLSNRLITARKFYRREALQKEIEEIRETICQNELTVKSNSEEVSCLVSTMDSLQLTPPEQDQGHEPPYKTRLLIWSMLQEEEDSVTASLHGLQTQHQEMCAVLQET